MTNSKDIAKLIGPSLIAISISETLNVHIWAANTAAGVHLNGSLLFVAGLSIVLAHNQWVRSWPDTFTYDFTNGITKYHRELMLISTECSILGPAFQEKYNIPKLPSQTVHIKAANTGHNIITLNPEWSLQAIARFFKP